MDKKDNSVEVFQEIDKVVEAGQKFAVALILEAEGSTPRKAGVRAVISDSGRIWGTLGGGAVEAQTQQRAIESCKTHKAVIFDMQLQGADRDDDIPICGGRVRILIDPITEKYKPLFMRAAEAIKTRTKGVILSSIFRTSEIKIDYQWLPQDSICADIGFPGREKIDSCIKSETPQLFTENLQNPTIVKEVFVEPVIPRPLLLIAGGGHVGQALALQANLVGFDIIVFDERPEFTDAGLFPEGVKTRCGDIAELVAEIPVEKDTHIVIVTHGHKNDAQALEACIKKPFSYIGMIGSRRKVALIREDFIQSGVCTAETFDGVFSPIGLDIGAVTVPEIAASIAAELIAVRRKGLIHKPLNRTELL